MKVVFLEAGTDAAQNFEQLTLRYKVAYVEYHDLVDKHFELSLSGSKPSARSLREEERRLDELDSARHALLDAAARAHPTVH